MKIKIHDVFHEKTEDIPSDLEKKIERWIKSGQSVEVKGVDVSWGYENSPIYITLGERNISISKIFSVVKSALRRFSDYVDGIDVDGTVRKDNIRVIEE